MTSIHGLLEKAKGFIELANQCRQAGSPVQSVSPPLGKVCRFAFYERERVGMAALDVPSEYFLSKLAEIPSRHLT